MLKLIGGDELANDPDWAGRKGRRRHRQDADALIDGLGATLADISEPATR